MWVFSHHARRNRRVVLNCLCFARKVADEEQKGPEGRSWSVPRAAAPPAPWQMQFSSRQTHLVSQSHLTPRVSSVSPCSEPDAGSQAAQICIFELFHSKTGPETWSELSHKRAS